MKHKFDATLMNYAGLPYFVSKNNIFPAMWVISVCENYLLFGGLLSTSLPLAGCVLIPATDSWKYSLLVGCYSSCSERGKQWSVRSGKNWKVQSWEFSYLGQHSPGYWLTPQVIIRGFMGKGGGDHLKNIQKCFLRIDILSDKNFSRQKYLDDNP